MKNILIGGGTGLVGKRLVQMLDKSKYKVYVLTRSQAKGNGINYLQWDPIKGKIELAGVKPDVIINLTGAGIVDKPWTKSRKELIISSRVESTRILEASIKSEEIAPELFISASAVGIYGDRDAEILDESSKIGNMSEFLVECCQLWESAADKIQASVDRLIKLRIGVVLSTKGGALGQLSRPVKLGVAGYFGNGKQFMPWIHIDDLCRMIIHSIENQQIEGIYNAVSPSPLSAKEFMRLLKPVYRKWALLLPAPSFIIRLAMGDRSKVILNSNRVVPSKFEKAGFEFKYENLTEAVSDLEDRKI